ncbi:MAG: TetR/AcrR family transcriptional regulator [Proteobacteria bacterium]|nr:TetR/AcrR family transcriptional regulator [Pseudomonadota bacterium]HQR05158.1 TetR/AcrR family transcriptional regulator [Rhodocyclaceae bacterium]
MPRIVDHDQRRDLIARAAAYLIAEQGLAGASFREIAARTGFSKGVIEHYFKGKDDIVGKTLDWVNARYVERETRLIQGKRGMARLHARLHAALPLTAEAVRYWKVRLQFWALASHHPEWQSDMERRMKLIYSGYRADLEDAVALGELDTGFDILTAVQSLVHFVSGASVHSLIAPAVFGREYLKGVSDHLIRDLRDMHPGQGDASRSRIPGLRSAA